MLRYLARRFNFYGGSKSDRIEIDVLQDEAYDFRNEIIKTVYTSVENYASVFEQFSTNTLPRYLDSFDAYLRHSDNTNFFVGSRLSLVDFVLYELFWQMTMMVPNSITK
jgi:glutathione S-transferase